MDWQNLIMIILTALLLFVWLPALVISVRKTIRKENNNKSNNSYGNETKV